MIRTAQLDEKVTLEGLQLRASLALEEYRVALLTHPDAIELPAHQIEKGQVFVATDCGEPTGFAAIELHGDGSAELDALFVEPSRWRQGIGTRLVEVAVNHVAGSGIDALTVVASLAGQKFYERCGFSVTGLTETRFGRAVLMVKEL